MAAEYDDQQARPLAGRRALVTGASRGIGAATALALGAAGADVVIGCRRHRDEAEVVAAEVRIAGGRCEVLVADLATPGGPAELAQGALRFLGSLDLLVLNAGSGSRGLPLERTSPAELERQFRLHAGSAHRLLAELLGTLRAATRSDVVAISSVATTVRPPGGAPYTMAKAALEALMDTLAAEERSTSVNVNVVAPGLVATEQGRGLVRQLTGGVELAEAAVHLPGGQALSPAAVADLVVLLASSPPRPGSCARTVIDRGEPHELSALGQMLRGELQAN